MATQTETKTNSSTATATEPDTMSGSLSKVDNQTLASIVMEGVKKERLSGFALLELRRRFAGLKDEETVLGYRKGQWTKCCREYLKISDRQARRLIESTGEEGPAAKHDGSAIRAANAVSAASSVETLSDPATAETSSRNARLLPPWMAKTPDGTPVEVANSAVQKAVRDGDEVAAVYWIRQLYFAERKVWKKLHIIAAEDIGLADLSVKTHVLELEHMAEKCKDDRNSDLLHLVLATMICCRAKKSRAVDNAILWFNEHSTWKPPDQEEIEFLAKSNLPQPAIPDKVYDMHTGKGRKLRRGMDHFKTVAAKLTNESDVAPFSPPTVSPQQDEKGVA